MVCQKSAPAFQRCTAILLSLSLILGDSVSRPGYSAPSRQEIIPPSDHAHEIFSLASLNEDPALRPYSNVGEIEEIRQNDGPSVIHIRDLHCNYEAQLNISKTIEVISKENPGQKILVMTEGAEGQVNTDLFGTFPDANVRMEASKAMMREGKITGPEYLSITQHGNISMEIQGVEKEDLYIQNFNAYREVIGESQETGEFLQSADEVLDQIKKKVFSAELYEFEQKRSDYEKGSVAFDQYTDYLGQTVEGVANLKEYPNFSLLMTLVSRQKELSVEKVEEERADVMTALNDKITKEELSDLIKASLEFRLGKKSAGEYFGKLENLIQEKLKTSDYPELGKYINLVRLQTTIQHQVLLDEVKKLGEMLESSLIKTEKDKKLIDFIRRFEILGRMFRLEMTREDLQYLHQNQESCRVEVLLKELDEYLMHMSLQVAKHLTDEKKIRYVAKVFDNGEKFYGYALERDQALFDNALEKMEESGVQVAVLVTGGFHSEGVTQRLKDKKMNYAVLTPRVTGQPDMSTYQELMLDDRISVQTISFVSLFNKVADRLSETLEAEELGKFADTLFRLMRGKGVGNVALEKWINDWVASRGGYERLSKSQQVLVDNIREKVGIEPAAETAQSFEFSEGEIENLIQKSSLLTAELTVEVLREMNHPALARAEGILEERKNREPGNGAKDLKGPAMSGAEAITGLPTAADLEPLEQNSSFTWRMRDRRTGKIWFLKINNARSEDFGYRLAQAAGVNIPPWTKVSLSDIAVPEELRNRWTESLKYNDDKVSMMAFLSQDIHEVSSRQLAEKDTAGMEGILAFLAFTGGQDFALRHNIEPLEIGGVKRYVMYDLTPAAGQWDLESLFGYDNRMIFDGWKTLDTEKLLQAVERLEKLSAEDIRQMAADAGFAPAQVILRTANLLTRQKFLRELIANNLVESMNDWNTGLLYLPLPVRSIQMYTFTNALNRYDADYQKSRYVEEIWDDVLKAMIGDESMGLYDRLISMDKDEIRGYALANNPFLISNLLAIQENFESLLQTLEKFLTPGTLLVVDDEFKKDFEISRDKGKEMLEKLSSQIENLKGLPFKEGEIYRTIYAAANKLTKNETAGQTDGGLIGRYHVLTKPVFDEEAGILKFKGRHIETGAEESIEIPAIKMDRSKIMAKFFNSPVDNEVLNSILDWFDSEFKGEVLILGPNPYGIEGLGNEDFVAVSEKLKEFKVAFFHEMAEAMGAAGNLAADNILESLQDRNWYDAHMAKPGREGMQLHYAIRALQREVFAQDDLDLTYVIKNRLTEKEARPLVMLKASKAGRSVQRESGLQLVRRVLNEFRKERVNVATREQEIKLLDDLFQAALQRVEQEDLIRQQQEAERTARQPEESRERNFIDQRLEEIRSILLEADSGTVAKGELEADTEKRIAEIVGILKGKNPEWLAEAILDLLEKSARKSFKGLVAEMFPNFLAKGGLHQFGPDVVNLVLAKLYQSAMAPEIDHKSAEATLDFLVVIINHISDFTPIRLETLSKVIASDIEKHVKSQPYVKRFQVQHIKDYEHYFDVDPKDSEILFFKKDYSKRVIWLRNLRERHVLDKLHKEAGFLREQISNISLRLFRITGDEVFPDILLKKLEDEKTSVETRLVILDLLSSRKTAFTPEEIQRTVEEIILLYDKVAEDQKSAVIEQLTRLSSHVQNPELQEKLLVFLQSTMGPLLEAINKSSEDLRAADEIHDAMKAEKPARPAEELKAAEEKVQAAREKQFALMDEFENRVKTLMALAQTAYDKNQSQVSMPIISYLTEVARNDKWDPSISAQIIWSLSDFIGNRFSEEGKFVFETFLQKLEPPVIVQEIKNNILAKDRIGEFIDPGIMVEWLKRPDLNSRTKYLLIQRHHKDEAFIRTLVFNRNESGKSLDLPVDLRLYALTWHAATLSHVDGENVVYDDKDFPLIMEALGKEASDFVQTIKSDSARFKGVYDNVWLQSEEAKVYVMATYLAMQHHLPISNAKGFIDTSKWIGRTRIAPYWENASSTFVIGGRIFRNASDISRDFLQIIAHELMHDILFYEYKFMSAGLKHLTLHEFLSDIHSFIFSEIFGLDIGSLVKDLGYHKHFDDVSQNDFHSVEAHEAARAQLETIRKAFASLGISLNLENWKQILKISLSMIKDSEVNNKNPKEFARILLRRLVRGGEALKESADEAEGLGALPEHSKSFFGLSVNPSDEQFRVPILGVSEILIMLLVRSASDVNIADVGLDAPEHRAVNEAIARAFAQGRIERRQDVNGRKVFVVKGVSALAGKQKAHAGIEFNAVYIAEGAYAETRVQHEVEELQRWQEKALQLAGMDPKTDWNRLSSDAKKALKEDMRNWMSLNFDEAQRLEEQFHEEANRLAPVPLDVEDDLSEPKPVTGARLVGKGEEVKLGGQFDGKRLGGKLSKTPFVGDAWIRAGMFSYRIKIQDGRTLFQAFDENGPQGPSLILNGLFKMGRFETGITFNDMNTYDVLLSQNHFLVKVTRENGQYFIEVEDLFSRNGTVVELAKPRSSRDNADEEPVITLPEKPVEMLEPLEILPQDLVNQNLFLNLRGAEVWIRYGDGKYTVYADSPSGKMIGKALEEGVTTLGRNADIRIRASDEVSRKHVELEVKDGKLIIRSIGETGTFYRGSAKELDRKESLKEIVENMLIKILEKSGLKNEAALIQSVAAELAKIGLDHLDAEELKLVVGAILPKLSEARAADREILSKEQKAGLAQSLVKTFKISQERAVFALNMLEKPQMAQSRPESGNFFIRVLEAFVGRAGRSLGKMADQIKDRIREAVYRNHARQILKSVLNENLAGQMKDFVRSHPKFIKAARTTDAVEILSRFVAYAFTGRNAKIFEMEKDGITVADDLEQILERVEFARVPSKIKRSEIEKIESAVPGLLNSEKPEESLRDILIEYRNLKAQGVENSALPERIKPLAESLEPLLIRQDDMGMPLTLAGLLLGENGTSKKDASEQRKMLITAEKQIFAGRAVGEGMRTAAVQLSGVMRNWDALQKADVFGRAGDGHDKNIFVIDLDSLVKQLEVKDGKISFEGVGAGLDEALQNLFGVRPDTKIKLMSPYSAGKTMEILKQLGVSEAQIPKIEVVENWVQAGTLEAVLKGALGVSALTSDAREIARKDVVVILSQKAQEILVKNDLGSYAKEMKVVVGQLGREEGASMIADVLGMALVLGSVEEAFQNGVLVPELKPKLRNLFRTVLADLLKDEQDPEKKIEELIHKIETEGFFRIPPVTDVMNDMMREILIEETYIEISA